MAASAAPVSSPDGEPVSSPSGELTIETVTSSKFPGLSVACVPHADYDGEKWDAAQQLEDVENSLLSGEKEITFICVTSLPIRMDIIAPELEKIMFLGIDEILDLSGVILPPKLKFIHVFVADGGIIWPRQFPSGLRTMWFWSCDCDDILPPAFPETLTDIDISICSFRRLPPLPQTLTSFRLRECPLEECPELPVHENWKVLSFERNGFTRMPESFFKIKRHCGVLYVVDAFDQEWFDSLEDGDWDFMACLTGGKTKAARA